jgi:hypothetical protein
MAQSDGLPPRPGLVTVHWLWLAAMPVVLILAIAITAVVTRATLRPSTPLGQPLPSPVAVSVSPSASASPSASPSPVDPLHDPCVIGTWTETSHTEDDQIEGNTVRLTSSGAVQKYAADGTNSLDFGSGITRSGTLSGTRYELITTGHVTFHWQSRGGSLLYSDPQASGTTTDKRNGSVQQTSPLQGGITPEQYTCAGDALREFGSDYTIELARVSHTA